MLIKGFIKLSLADYPGHVACVLFTPGCNLRCKFCHNRALVLSPELLPTFKEKDVFAYLGKRKNVLEGVCVTGGEPTLFADLVDFLLKVKALGLKVKLDSNGTSPEALEKVIAAKAVDYFAIDVKVPLGDSYHDVTGLGQAGVERIKRSLSVVANSGLDYEIRTTVVPGIHDSEVLVAMSEQLKPILGEDFKWFLQPFLPRDCIDEEFTSIASFSQEELESMLSAVMEHVPSSKLR